MVVSDDTRTQLLKFSAQMKYNVGLMGGDGHFIACPQNGITFAWEQSKGNLNNIRVN